MPSRPTGRHLLAQAIEAERRAGRAPATNVELATAADISRAQVDIVVHGRGEGSYRQTTLNGIDRAMGWVGGSAEAVMAGGRPERFTDVERARAEWNRLFDQLTVSERQNTQAHVLALLRLRHP